MNFFSPLHSLLHTTHIIYIGDVTTDLKKYIYFVFFLILNQKIKVIKKKKGFNRLLSFALLKEKKGLFHIILQGVDNLIFDIFL